ncbi:MAG: hypothetical protein ACI4JN_01925, partial [Ruminococcus sp.]
GGTITANGTYTAAGSLIGCANDINVTGVADEYEYTISGITVNGVSIDTENSTTNIVYSGGLIGALKSFISANCTISDCHVVGQSNGNTIKATSVVSGLIAVDNMKTTIDKCSVENYSLSANISNNNNPCGGLIGKVERNDTILKNSYIKKCTIQYNGNVSDAKRIGGIAGYVNDSITFSGYNVAVKDVNIVNSNTTNVGTAMGGVNSTASAKFVGVSISGNTGDAVNTFGSSKGKDSYVICSDMNGTCLDASPNSEHSNVNFTDIPHIEDYGSSPYAAINPKTDIDSSMFLTGDGASAALKDNAELSDYKFSTFAAEMGLTEDSLTYDFPVLVVNESDKDTLTNSINTYIKILTGTNYQIAPKSDVNYADPDDAANSQLFNIDISQYKLNDAGDSFEKNENLSDKSLTCSGRYFQMTNKHYDNANNQFTLLDVQFKNPLDTAQIAYHLYIPIVVVKMLKFDFNTGISSGTTYKTDLYTNKVAMENYGSPVTTYIEYSYQRTVKEWNDALNAGENFLKYYGKFVHFDYSSDTKFNDDTNLVLVDCNNGDKAYYSALGTCFDKENTKKLDFHAFKDSSDTPFEPVSFYELLKQSADITAALNESGNGKFVKLDNETEAAVKAVLDGNECYFRLKDSAKDTADIQTYDIEIKALNESLQAADILPVKEKYYLSIFTNIPEAADSIVQVKIESFRRLGDDDMTPSLVNNNNPSTMIVGNLYKQEISFSTDPLAECKISEDNSVIKVNELQSTISINAADPTMIQAIKYNMATVNLFHGFVLDMNITDADGTRNGIYGTPQVTGSYSINSKEYDIDYSVSNFVITITGKDCGQAVKEALINNNNNSVTISCSNLEIDYYESSDINGQFPIRPDGNTAYGAIVYAKSNIAYDNSDNVKNSNTSVSQRDTYEKSFYIEGNLKIASLNYNIPTGTTDADKFAALGVNGRVSEEHINAVGYYDVSDISEDVLSTAKRLIVSLELQRKNSDGNYTSNEILIPDYLSGFTLDVNGSDNLFDVNNSAAPIEYEISAIPTDKTFKINTSFNVITGEKFEEKGYLYS